MYHARVAGLSNEDLLRDRDKAARRVAIVEKRAALAHAHQAIVQQQADAATKAAKRSLAETKQRLRALLQGGKAADARAEHRARLRNISMRGLPHSKRPRETVKRPRLPHSAGGGSSADRRPRSAMVFASDAREYGALQAADRHPAVRPGSGSAFRSQNGANARGLHRRPASREAWANAAAATSAWTNTRAPPRFATTIQLPRRPRTAGGVTLSRAGVSARSAPPIPPREVSLYEASRLTGPVGTGEYADAGSVGGGVGGASVAQSSVDGVDRGAPGAAVDGLEAFGFAAFSNSFIDRATELVSGHESAMVELMQRHGCYGELLRLRRRDAALRNLSYSEKPLFDRAGTKISEQRHVPRDVTELLVYYPGEPVYGR